MAFTLIKRCSMSIKTRKMQIKATFNYHFSYRFSKEKTYQFDNHKGMRKQCSHPLLVKSKTVQAP